MKVTYDPEANAAYVYLVDSIAAGAVAQTRPAMLELDGAFVAIDFDSDGKMLGIEILGARDLLSEDTLRTAVRLPEPDHGQ